MNRISLIWTIFLLTFWSTIAFGQVFKTTKASAYFKSDAPLELIEAKSQKLQGAINLYKRTFAFTIPIRSFEGFNSPLQREHFNENYLESGQFPNATFTGKIIEKFDFTKDGKYTLRAKGKLTIHGITQERIIKSRLEIKKGKLYVNTNFTILLDEHQIRIPKIVHQKIAKEIMVYIDAVFEK